MDSAGSNIPFGCWDLYIAFSNLESYCIHREINGDLSCYLKHVMDGLPGLMMLYRVAGAIVYDGFPASLIPRYTVSLSVWTWTSTIRSSSRPYATLADQVVIFCAPTLKMHFRWEARDGPYQVCSHSDKPGHKTTTRNKIAQERLH